MVTVYHLNTKSVWGLVYEVRLKSYSSWGERANSPLMKGGWLSGATKENVLAFFFSFCLVFQNLSAQNIEEAWDELNTFLLMFPSTW